MKKQFIQKPIALLLALILLITLLPVMSAAVDPTDITVYVTVCDQGMLATDKNSRIVAQVPVTLSGAASYTIDDAFRALHEAGYAGGAALGYATSAGVFGISVDKFWGKTTGTAFYVNNIASNGVTDAISDGDDITAYILYDTTFWSDLYAYFSRDTLYTETGVNQTLTLKSDSWGTGGVIASAQLVTVSDDGTRTPIAGAITDAGGQTDVRFETAGTYIISAETDTTRTAPVCKVYVADCGQPHVTVRIEGNGFGTDGTSTGIGTVLPDTVVNLSELDGTPTALEAVNYALKMNGLPTAAGAGGYYTSFGSVAGAGGASWMFMLDDAYPASGLDGTLVSNGGNIVLALADYSLATGTYTTGYSYFKVVSVSGGVQWGYACGVVTLALYDMTNSGWNPDYSPKWDVSAVLDTAVYANGVQAYTPDSIPAVTDGENGVAEINLWGGTTAGTYYFDITATVNGSTNPYCRVKMVFDGTNAPVMTFSQPSAANTALSGITLTFPGVSPMSGLSYVGTDGMTVNNAVDSVIVSAAASDAATPAIVAGTFRAAGGSSAAYTPGSSAVLAVGENTFKFTVTNGTDMQIHTLIITREAATVRNICEEVAAVLNGVKTVTGDAPYTDWILAMHAAGLEVTNTQLNTYLAAVLSAVDDFVDQGTGSVGNMAKIAVALTALGIDARQIPDPDGGAATDLVAEIASYGGTVDPVYAAPYILALYDLGNYEVPAGARITRSGLITSIVNAQDAVTNLWAGADGTGMVLPSLAAYYNASAAVNSIDITTCGTVTAAISRAVTALSTMQAVDGGLGSRNSNTTATVVTGLNAIGVNPHTDARFVKSGSTQITDLLSFRTVDDKLGYKSNVLSDTMACYQGFEALATYQNLTEGVRNRNLYRFSTEIAPYTGWPDAKLLTGIAVTTQPTVATYACDETETAFAPDTTGIVITATYNADASNSAVIPIADCSVSTIDCSTPGSKTVIVAYQGKTATFMVTVLNGDSSAPVQKTAEVTVKKGSKIIAGETAVIEEDVTSALDVLKTVLASAGKTVLIRNGSYVASIDGLGEFDEGANAGWLYSVNGVTPSSTAAGEYRLRDGDVVLWYYTLDYTADKSASEWKGAAPLNEPGTVAPNATVTGGTAAASVTEQSLSDAVESIRESGATIISITPTIEGAVSRVDVTVPRSSVQEIAADTDAALLLSTPAARVEIGNDTLASIAAQAGGSAIEFSVETKAAADVNIPDEDLRGSIIVAVSITSDGKSITRFGGNALKISLPVGGGYIGGETYKVIVISADGSMETLWGKAAVTDGKTAVDVTVTHLSTFIVTDQRVSAFTDVASDAWYASAVWFAADRGLLQGTGGGLFRPDAEMTRAMFAAVLYRMEGKPAHGTANTFSDVESGAWYTDAIIWANESGIVKGVGGGKFGLGAPVTRQEAATMLYRYAVFKGCDIINTESLTASDAVADVPDWARDAVAWADAERLITGMGDTMPAPGGSASRAEAAAMLMQFVENVI